MGVAAILVMWPGPFKKKNLSRVLRSLNMKFEFNWPSGFIGEDIWKCWQMDRRRTDAGVPGILLAHLWAFGSGELKKGIYFMRISWQMILMKYHTLNVIFEKAAKVCCITGMPLTIRY